MRCLLKFTTVLVLVVGSVFSITTVAEARSSSIGDEVVTACNNPFNASACQAQDPPVNDTPNSGGGGGAY
ncbi:MAG: hypothetical protein P5700_14115 [Arthrospira platensis PCC 7345]|uniref:Secreted protein n=1 Tax=Limnospira platensis NIES-46 TaxID=1236695 RepID=A0A5M3T4C9_LIMPL|nr:hypothetical protein [Arthrospira sp. SH-MAG29]MBS0015228.1 hypothetical protein [Arthrospira sp. SH-MAG29]MDT9296167.1 hypothetical protein [Arthrospira platensis PCC 7345]GCE92656.1 hypothetical protein NIES46_06960 [Arthrospira platensis NIES-46]